MTTQVEQMAPQITPGGAMVIEDNKLPFRASHQPARQSYQASVVETCCDEYASLPTHDFLLTTLYELLAGLQPLQRVAPQRHHRPQSDRMGRSLPPKRCPQSTIPGYCSRSCCSRWEHYYRFVSSKLAVDATWAISRY